MISKPISTQTSSSSSSSSSSSLSSASNNKIIREVSFSSYLDADEKNFIIQLGCSKSVPSNLNSSISTNHILFEQTKPDEKEIEVFGAQKYFKDGLNQSSRIATKNLTNRHHLEEQEIFTMKDPNQIGTPSIRSESSSNSRSALLHRVPRNLQQPRQTNKMNHFLSGIRCKCYCNDMNSVEIDGETRPTDHNGKSKEDHTIIGHHLVVKKPQTVYNYVKFDEPELRLNTEARFSFPVFNPRIGNLHQTTKTQLQDKNHIRAHKPIEVFGSPMEEKGKNGADPEKKLSMLTWDAIAPAGGITEKNRIPPPMMSYEDSYDSDESSDLFEIESLSKGGSFLSRQESDGTPECITAAKNCYAPSEASVEWSVMTESTTDFEELRSDSTNIANAATTKAKEMVKWRSGIFPGGCKNQKAVRVAGDGHRLNYDQKKKMNGAMTVIKSESVETVPFDARIFCQSNSRNAAHMLHVE